GLAVLQRQSRRQGAAGALARHEARRRILVEPRDLQPRAEAEAELWNDRRTLQPTAARGRRDHVPPAVDDVDVNGVAGDGAERARRRLAHVAIYARHGSHRRLSPST